MRGRLNDKAALRPRSRSAARVSGNFALFSKARFSGEPPSIEVSVDFSEAEGPNDVTDSSDVSVSSTRVRRERHTPVARRSRRDAHDDDRRYLPASRAVAGNASEARLTARDRA